MNPKLVLSRRSILRGLLGGAAVSVCLPPLEAMFDGNGAAYADGSPIPKRFGHFFWGNGVKPDRFLPPAPGTDWRASPPPSLKPFADVSVDAVKGVLEYVSVVGNTWVPFPFSWAHATSYVGMMSGAQPVDASGKPDYQTGQYPMPAGPLVIDAITKALGAQTKFQRIDTRISRAVSGAGYLTGDPKASQHNPQALFDKLFAGVSPTTVPPSQGMINARKGVLDAVAADATKLRGRLGAGDQKRLDAHLDNVASLQRRIATAGAVAGCVVPKDPGPRPPDLTANNEPLVEVHKAMADLVAYAMACDISRVFNYAFSDMQSSPIYWQVGVTDFHHPLGHDEPGNQPKIQKTTEFIMSQFAYLLARLKSVPVGGNNDNLLDHSCIWGTSEIEDPQTHGFRNIPQIVAGRAGGALKGGVYHDAGGDPDWSKRFDKPAALHSNLVLTMMRAVGMTASTFGLGSSAATTTMHELEA